jgi:uncharacterized protein YdcH (DUF465 family)
LNGERTTPPEQRHMADLKKQKLLAKDMIHSARRDLSSS